MSIRKSIIGILVGLAATSSAVEQTQEWLGKLREQGEINRARDALNNPKPGDRIYIDTDRKRDIIWPTLPTDGDESEGRFQYDSDGEWQEE